MFRRRFIGGLLAMLLIFGGLNFIGRTSYSRGWTDGYFTSQQAESSEDGAETAVPPTYRSPYYGRGYHSPFLWFVGGIFKFWLFMMLFGLIFKMMFFRRWRRGGWGGHRYHRRGPWGGPPHHWGKPPWDNGDDDEPYEKSPEDVEPDIRSA